LILSLLKAGANPDPPGLLAALVPRAASVVPASRVLRENLGHVDRRVLGASVVCVDLSETRVHSVGWAPVGTRASLALAGTQGAKVSVVPPAPSANAALVVPAEPLATQDGKALRALRVSLVFAALRVPKARRVLHPAPRPTNAMASVSGLAVAAVVGWKCSTLVAGAPSAMTISPTSGPMWLAASSDTAVVHRGSISVVALGPFGWTMSSAEPRTTASRAALIDLGEATTAAITRISVFAAHTK